MTTVRDILLALAALLALFMVAPQAAQASSQNGADMVIINPGGGQLANGSDGLLSVFNGEDDDSPNFFNDGPEFAPEDGSDQQFFAGTYQWCCGGAGPILYAGTPTIAPMNPLAPNTWPAAASKFVGEAGAANNNGADSWSVGGGGVEIISTSGAVVRVPAGQGATAFPAGAPTGSGSATIRYTAIVGVRTYVIDRAISYTYPNNFYTETYTFTVPAGNTHPVQYYLGGDAAPGSSDQGFAATTTSPNRVLYEINPAGGGGRGIFVAYGEVGSPATSPFSSGYVADYDDPVYDAIERGYSLVTGCGLDPDQIVVDTNFCIDPTQHDAGLDIQWTLPATPGTYTRQMRTIVGFQGQSVSARFTPSSVASGQSSNLEIELVNTGFNPVNGVGFSLPLPTGLSISGAATNSCNGVLTATSGGTSVALTGGDLPGGGNCLVSVPVTGAVGTYTVNDQDFQNLAPGTLTKGFGNSTLQIGEPPPPPPPAAFVLLVNKPSSNTGNGTVTSNPAGINCGNTCQKTYYGGPRVTLTATPAPGSRFTGWSGACTNQTGTCEVAMNDTRVVFARFTAASHVLRVEKQGNGQGTVTSSPAGIDCGTACEASFEEGTQVTLTASPAQSSEFTGWSGACTGTGPCQVTMDEARQVTATFAELAPPRLSITKYIQGPRRLNASRILRLAWVECESGTCQIDDAKVSFKARGKDFPGSAIYPEGPFQAGERRLISTRVPDEVNERLTSRKSGVAILDVRASARNGDLEELVTRTVRQGLIRCPVSQCG